MPRKAPDDSGGKVIHATVTLKPSVVRQYVDEIEALQAEIDSIEQGSKKRKAPKRQQITKLMKQAAEDGLPKKELAAVLRYRRYMRKADGVVAELDDEQKETYEKMRAAAPWEGTPLAQAAAE